jgi:hypothetical protein
MNSSDQVENPHVGKETYRGDAELKASRPTAAAVRYCLTIAAVVWYVTRFNVA